MLRVVYVVVICFLFRVTKFSLAKVLLFSELRKKTHLDLQIVIYEL